MAKNIIQKLKLVVRSNIPSVLKNTSSPHQNRPAAPSQSGPDDKQEYATQLEQTNNALEAELLALDTQIDAAISTGQDELAKQLLIRHQDLKARLTTNNKQQLDVDKPSTVSTQRLSEQGEVQFSSDDDLNADLSARRNRLAKPE